MRLEGGREQRTCGGEEHAKRQVLRRKTPSSEKSKTQLLSGWTNFPPLLSQKKRNIP